MNVKEIIFSQLENKFKEADIQRITLNYDMINKKSSCRGLTNSGNTVNIILTKTENFLITTMFINKVKRIIKRDFVNFIVDVKVSEKDINLYIKEFNNSELEKVVL